MDEHAPAKSELDPASTCFVIAPIGDDGSPVRTRSDKVLRHIISPVAEACGLLALRADRIQRPGIITSDVIRHVVGDRMVVADLTGSNPNVFYELAVRHAFGMPYVQMIEKGERLPFDISAARTIHVDHRDLDSVEECKQEMQAHMQAALAQEDRRIESPVSISIGLAELVRSDDPQQLRLADVLATVQDLGAQVSALSRDVRTALWSFSRRGHFPFDLESCLSGLSDAQSALSSAEWELDSMDEVEGDEIGDVRSYVEEAVWAVRDVETQLSRLRSHPDE